MTHFINAATDPILSIVPTGDPGATSITMLSTQTVGTTFSVDVRIDDYSTVNIGGTNNGINGASYVVTWDPTVLAYQSYTDGAWLPSQSNTGDLSNKVANGQLTIGQIAFGSSSFITADSASGSVSATIIFQVLSNSVGTTIGLEQQGANVPYLIAPETVGGLTSGHAVSDVTAVNAQYGTVASPTPSPTGTPIPTSSPTPTPTPTPTSSPTPTPTSSPTPSGQTQGPIAIITNQNGTTYQTGEPILLDGGTSTAGYDANSAETCPITNYAWLVQYENDSVFGVYSGGGVTINVNSATSLHVTLIVTAPDVDTSPNSQYTNTSTTSVWINVQTAQSLTKMDFFSSQSVYGPQQLVQLYVYVTYNGAPEPNENVAFTVINPSGTIVSVRTAFTNETGYAYTDYITPNIASSIGTWTAISSVEVNQVIITNKITYEYNYLVTVTTNGITVPSTVARGGTITVTVAIQNTGDITLSSVVTITIYDQDNVPIATDLLPVTNAASGATVSGTFTIPTWAAVGEATVYVNILSADPTAGGVPLCPEQTANFQITA